MTGYRSTPFSSLSLPTPPVCLDGFIRAWISLSLLPPFPFSHPSSWMASSGNGCFSRSPRPRRAPCNESEGVRLRKYHRLYVVPRRQEEIALRTAALWSQLTHEAHCPHVRLSFHVCIVMDRVCVMSTVALHRIGCQVGIQRATRDECLVSVAYIQMTQLVRSGLMGPSRWP